VNPAGGSFSPEDERLKLGSEDYSPGLLKKIEYAGGTARSFQTEAESLGRLAECSISARHVERLTERLCREMERVRGPGGAEPSEDKTPEKSRRKKEKKKAKKPRRRKRPERLVRTVVATTAPVEPFGWMVSAEAMKRKMFAAARLAYGKDAKAAWELYERMLRDAWGGKVQGVIEMLRSQASRLRADSAGTDACRVVELALAYVERNRERMDYPRYRRMGLPVSSSLVESLIKQVNHRVKGTEQFWNNGGLEAVLQVCAAYLSEDGRAETFYQRRPRGAAVGNNHAKFRQPAR